MDRIKFVALGGLDENGKNIYCLDINSNIFVIEAGIKYPIEESLGIEYLIADLSYLERNKKRVKAIFISHAHDDVSQALTQVLAVVKVPIYTGKFSKIILETRINKDQQYQINGLSDGNKINIEGVEIEAVALTHSFPNNLAFAFKTSLGYIFYASEFIFDQDYKSPAYQYKISNLARFNKKVLLLLCESIYADNPGFTTPKHRIANQLDNFLNEAESRVIIACYLQSVFRLEEIINKCIELDRKVFLYNQELRDYVYLISKTTNRNFAKLQITNNIHDEDVVVLIAESPKKLFETIIKIATRSNHNLKLKTNDSFILCENSFAGLESLANDAVNELFREGCVVYRVDKNTLSMHPSIEDIKLMLNILEPKYYLPIKGYYRLLDLNRRIAESLNYRDDKIIVLDNGEMIEFDDKSYKLIETFEVKDKIIDKKDSFDVDDDVIRERKLLANSGFIIIGLGFSFHKKKIVTGPDIQSRGLAHVRDVQEVLDECRNIVHHTMGEVFEANLRDYSEIRLMIKERIAAHINKSLKKKPIVLVTISDLTKIVEIK